MPIISVSRPFRDATTVTRRICLYGKLFTNSDAKLENLSNEKNHTYIVSTASRGIGLEFTSQLLQRTNGKVVALYRGFDIPPPLSTLSSIHGTNRLILIGNVDLENQITILNVNHSLMTIEGIGHIKLLINVSGILGDGVSTPGPERSLDRIDHDWLVKTMNANLIGHVLLTKEILELVKKQKVSTAEDPMKIVCLSARVGSISDNRLGGWYSYRMSKAALNMFMKTLSIEIKRHNAMAMSIHPGTTDTDLSKPFQKNVKADKLFSVEKSVSMMLDVIWKSSLNDTGKFVAYDGTVIPF